MMTQYEAKLTAAAYWDANRAKIFKNAESYCEKTANGKIAKASAKGCHFVKVKVPGKFSYQAVRKVLESNGYEVEMEMGGRFTIKW